ncbi:MAG: ABC transporter ATP-binding protein [Prevotella sp.]|nr:ABC transporter ATP-binding protein [Prevotella sp.]
MIKIQSLKKTFGEKTAVDIADFTINSGDILGLVGNNGAGKTTLFRLILDLLKADEGTVTIQLPAREGEEPLSVNSAESEVWKQNTGAYIDEGFLIEFLTPEEFFQFVGKAGGMTKQEVDERLKIFEQFMGGEIMGHKKLIRNLSAGNKHKVGTISTLLNKPSLVILDEPFNFLDPTSQNVLKQLLVDYNHETGATILVSSHNLAHTVEISTRIALLEQGVIIRDLNNIGGSAEKELEDYFIAPSKANKAEEGTEPVS